MNKSRLDLHVGQLESALSEIKNPKRRRPDFLKLNHEMFQNAKKSKSSFTLPDININKIQTSEQSGLATQDIQQKSDHNYQRKLSSKIYKGKTQIPKIRTQRQENFTFFKVWSFKNDVQLNTLRADNMKNRHVWQLSKNIRESSETLEPVETLLINEESQNRESIDDAEETSYFREDTIRESINRYENKIQIQTRPILSNRESPIKELKNRISVQQIQKFESQTSLGQNLINRRNMSSMDIIHDSQWGVNKKLRPLVRMNSDIDQFMSDKKSKRKVNKSYNSSKSLKQTKFGSLDLLNKIFDGM